MSTLKELLGLPRHNGAELQERREWQLADIETAVGEFAKQDLSLNGHPLPNNLFMRFLFFTPDLPVDHDISPSEGNSVMAILQRRASWYESFGKDE